jgi:hypothetical protein
MLNSVHPKPVSLENWMDIGIIAPSDWLIVQVVIISVKVGMRIDRFEFLVVNVWYRIQRYVA